MTNLYPHVPVWNINLSSMNVVMFYFGLKLIAIDGGIVLIKNQDKNCIFFSGGITDLLKLKIRITHKTIG